MTDENIIQEEQSQTSQNQNSSQDEAGQQDEERQASAQPEEAQNGQQSQETQEQAAKPDQTEELKNALARAMADLQNFKRRSEEERGRFVKFANLELLKNLLPILNNLQRSADHLPQDLKENEWAKGVMGVHSDMKKTLEKMGIQKIETVGQLLNPTLHEALMSGPGEKDRITEEFESGYTYHGEVIWPAKVKVGDGTE